MQDVIHVDHTYSAEDMMRAGRDVEKMCSAARCIRCWHSASSSMATAPLFCNRSINRCISFRDAPSRIKKRQTIHFLHFNALHIRFI